jgi:hypothetical protein
MKGLPSFSALAKIGKSCFITLIPLLQIEFIWG